MACWTAGLLERLAARWNLHLEQHFEDIEINYVAPATLAGGTPCVLKVSRHIRGTRTEIAALQLWDGDGAARVLQADAESGALLVERLEPGTMLVEVAERDDDQATCIAAGVLRRLWRPAPRDHGLRQLESWCAAYDRNPEALAHGARGFPAGLFVRADALRRDLLDSTDVQATLHGDMHHYNLLRAECAGWLAIDPKGLVGDRVFDVCQFYRNPHPPVPVQVNRRRPDSFCAELGLDRQRTRDRCSVHAMLDAC